MKNLENYGVVSLDAGEINKANGGGFWAGVAFCYFIDICANTDAHIAAFKEGFNAGFN